MTLRLSSFRVCAAGILASGGLKSKSDLANLLMAWYQAGYATGSFSAQHPELLPEEEEDDGEGGEEEDESDGGDGRFE